MGNKKGEYDYCRTGEQIEIIIKDANYKKVEHFKINLRDKKMCHKIFSVIEHKYGFVNPEIPHDKSINVKNQEDNNWLNMDNEFFK